LGTVHQLTEMSTEYLWAVLGYLRWYAPQVRSLVDDDLADPAALRTWLTGQPIWGAVACELVRRGVIEHPAAAMEGLASAGPVPWEVGNASD
jgi:hypothetical protein